MHPCWTIPEIAIGIIEQCGFRDDYEYQDDKSPARTLCAVARTCRALQEHALNALWYRQDSLTPLIKCLPCELWEVPQITIVPSAWSEWMSEAFGTDMPSGALRLTHARPMEPADWVRFDYHAQRILRFLPHGVEDVGPPYNAMDVLETLRAMRDGPLLPSLASVSFDHTWASACDILTFITCVGPASLSEIKIMLAEGTFGSNLPVTLPALASSHPSVTHVSFHVFEAGCDLDTITDTLSIWHQLRVLRLRFSPSWTSFTSPTAVRITSQTLAKLGSDSLPRLGMLTLSMDKDLSYTRDVSGDGRARPIPFHALRDLTIEIAQTAHVTDMLEDIEFTDLRRLEISVLDIDAFLVLPTVIQAHQSLLGLEVLSIRSCPPSDTGTKIEGVHLRPLTHLRRLRSLTIGISHLFLTIDTNDSDWDSLAQAWPHLRHLSVVDMNGGSTFYRGTRPRPTLLSLVHLARHCPELESVTMTLTMTLDLDTGLMNGALPVHDRLKELNLSYSTCDDIGEAATSLSQVFPRLASISRLPPARPRIRGEARGYTEETWTELLLEVRRRQEETATAYSHNELKVSQT